MKIGARIIVKQRMINYSYSSGTKIKDMAKAKISSKDFKLAFMRSCSVSHCGTQDMSPTMGLRGTTA